MHAQTDLATHNGGPSRVHALVDHLTEAVGGKARRRAVTLLASVIALSAADVGVVASMAAQLERQFRVGTTDIGLLVTVSSLAGALGTIPAGVLADRFSRTRLLYISVLVWGAAEVAGGLSQSYLMLLMTRLALGLLTAVAYPAVASLTGDLFPARERGRLYGFILAGEVLGTGAGVVVASLVGGSTSWRGAFFVLAIPSPLLYFAIKRLLPEPARGGQSWLMPGDEELKPAEEVQDLPSPIASEEEYSEDEDKARDEESSVVAQVEAQGIAPAEEIVPTEDPGSMSILEVARYVLKVRTNLILIISSSLGYFFLGGLTTFGLLYVRGRLGLGQAAATAVVLVVGGGTLLGVLSGGRLADRLIARGHLNARIWVGAVGYIAAGLVLVPAVFSSYLLLSLPLFVLAGITLAMPNPPLDAARLDVVGSRLWGRAEGVRSLLKTVLQAFAPLTFGFVASLLGAGAVSFGSGVNSQHVAVSAAQTKGLEYTFLIMVLPLVGSGLLLLLAARHYPTDVASAAEMDRREGESRSRGENQKVNSAYQDSSTDFSPSSSGSLSGGRR